MRQSLLQILENLVPSARMRKMHRKATLFLSLGIATAISLGMIFTVSVTASIDDTPLYILCEKADNYSLNSSFRNNLKQVLDTLANNSATTGSFNTTTSGDSPDQVFGQALCRGDVSGGDCQRCVRLAGQEILKNCSRKDADIWYESCQVSYSYTNFFSEMTYQGKYAARNSSLKAVHDSQKFNSILSTLMSNLKMKATGESSSRIKFGEGAMKFSANGTVYGLVQCSMGITGNECLNCLNSAIGDLTNHYYSEESGIIVSRYCNARFELHRFYNKYSSGKKWKTLKVLSVIFVLLLVMGSLSGFCLINCRRRKMTRKDPERNDRALLQELANPTRVAISENGELVSSIEVLFMDLALLKEATDDFLDGNKIGEGGFGKVYRGLLPDGTEIAVKRLSRMSLQGLEEFKNEIVLIARLKHQNLVSLLGWGTEGNEKLLVYEFMPNRSLDAFIFDQEKSRDLDWRTRYNIIDGIARGLLYLHEGSRLKIIHRDLKPSNILLDNRMFAKISDFGIARIFFDKQHHANTKRVIGTFGYMAPEYAMEGLFSTKSDVFSFGVIVLEVISGKKNSGFDLAKHAWMLWKEHKEVKFIDPSLTESCSMDEVRRCMHIGLLCVQEDQADRPNMADVVVLIESGSNSLPEPKQPMTKIRRDAPIKLFSDSTHISVYGDTGSPISPR